MRVALCGTPGTGKTSVADLLKKQRYCVVHLHQFAKDHHCVAGKDRKRNTELIDMVKLEKAIRKQYAGEALVFFDGHIGHLLQSMQNTTTREIAFSDFLDKVGQGEVSKVLIKGEEIHIKTAGSEDSGRRPATTTTPPTPATTTSSTCCASTRSRSRSRSPPTGGC